MDQEGHAENIRALEERHRLDVLTLHSQVRSKEKQIEELRSSLSEAEHRLDHSHHAAKNEMVALERNLLSKRAELEMERSEHERLKQHRDITRKQSKSMIDETAVMQLDINKLRRENDELAESIKKLSKIVYGRNVST